MKTPTRPTVRIAVLLAVSLTLCLGVARSSPTKDPHIARVETNLLPYQIIDTQPAYRLQDRMDHYRVPGVSIAVIEDFEVQWVAHYGVKAAASAEPVDGETYFNVGSLSKAMTSACILSLVEQGEIDLRADVNPQLTSWRIPENEFTAQARVTPLLLMNHSAGLPHRPPYTYTADQMPTTLQMVNGEPPSRATPLRVVQVPGTGFQYSNGGFTVLQILAEDVTGLPFDEAARRQVFAPLGLAHATFTTPLPADVMPEAATGHGTDGEIYADPQVWMPHLGAGGLWITAEDYARFVVELQKSAHGESNRLFSKQLALEMLSPHAATVYGLGVFLYEGNGAEPFFGHIGDGPGFVAGFTSHRTKGFGAVVMTNGQGGINLCREVMRSVAKVYDWPGYLPATRHEMPLTREEADRLKGRYRLELDTVISLKNDGATLELSSESIGVCRLYRVAPDTLVCLQRNGELALGVDPATGVRYIDYRLSDEIGRVGDTPRRATLLAAGETTPLEKLLAGQAEAAQTEYLEFMAGHPGHPDIQESRFNRLGYRLLREENVAGALHVFRLNTVLYPTSGNVFDSYGEALLASGRKDEAIASYERSLELDPQNTNAARILAELGAGGAD